MKRKKKELEDLNVLDKKTKFKHEQHTSRFYQELNSPQQNVQQPFRIMDNKWVIGKHKGIKLEDTPKSYIKWILNNFKNLSTTHKSILKRYGTD